MDGLERIIVVGVSFEKDFSSFSKIMKEFLISEEERKYRRNDVNHLFWVACRNKKNSKIAANASFVSVTLLKLQNTILLCE